MKDLISIAVILATIGLVVWGIFDATNYRMMRVLACLSVIIVYGSIGIFLHISGGDETPASWVFLAASFLASAMLIVSWPEK